MVFNTEEDIDGANGGTFFGLERENDGSFDELENLGGSVDEVAFGYNWIRDTFIQFEKNGTFAGVEGVTEISVSVGNEQVNTLRSFSRQDGNFINNVSECDGVNIAGSIRFSGVDNNWIVLCCISLDLGGLFDSCGFAELIITENRAVLRYFDGENGLAFFGNESAVNSATDFLPSIEGQSSEGTDQFDVCGIPNNCQELIDAAGFSSGEVIDSTTEEPTTTEDITTTEDNLDGNIESLEELLLVELLRERGSGSRDSDDGDSDDDSDDDDSDDDSDDSDDSDDDDARSVIEMSDNNNLEIANNDINDINGGNGFVDNDDDNKKTEDYSVYINFSDMTLINLWGMIAVFLIFNVTLFICCWKKGDKNEILDSSSINDI